MSTFYFPQPQGSFVALPQDVMTRLLCLDLTRRELVVLLLVARLTYGCRGKVWATLRGADLRVVGIGANHAKEVLARLIERGILVRGETATHYRLSVFVEEETERTETAERKELLKKLVRNQLAKSPKREPAFSVNSPSEKNKFPKEEEITSLKGNTSTNVAWRFSRSQGRFLKENEGSIEKER